jgi:hypothetical protein
MAAVKALGFGAPLHRGVASEDDRPDDAGFMTGPVANARAPRK